MLFIKIINLFFIKSVKNFLKSFLENEIYSQRFIKKFESKFQNGHKMVKIDQHFTHSIHYGIKMHNIFHVFYIFHFQKK